MCIMDSGKICYSAVGTGKYIVVWSETAWLLLVQIFYVLVLRECRD